VFEIYCNNDGRLFQAGGPKLLHFLFCIVLYCTALCTECYTETRVTENTEGMLYYPGFDQYGNNVHCEWIFTAPDGYVGLSIIVFHLLHLAESKIILLENILYICVVIRLRTVSL